MAQPRTFAAGLLLLAAVAAAQQDRNSPTAAPKQVVGNRWTYVILDPVSKAPRGEFEAAVVGVEANRIRVEVKSAGDLNGMEVHDATGALLADSKRAYDPPRRVFQFPLAPGKTWTYTTTFPFVDRGCTTSTLELEAQVVGWESVTVPAGTFRALRVDHTGRWVNCAGGDSHRERHWYVPELKNDAKVEVVFGTRGGTDGRIYELKASKVD